MNRVPLRPSLLLTKSHEDWSDVRSPSRARRRRKRGYPQRVKYVTVPDPKVYIVGGVIHGHPDTLSLMLAEMERRS